MKSLAVFLAVLLPPLAAQAQFTYELDQPKARISIPAFPALKMAPHPEREKSPHLRALGTQDPFAVSVLAPTAEGSMSAADCANTLIRVLPRRPGAPPQDRIQKARIDANTYIAAYVSSFGQLHAHLFSAAGGTHCIEVHASRMNPSNSDVAGWLRGFVDAKIEPR
jgi:hypothetical protein